VAENAIVAFSLDEAARLARLSERQLVYWHQTAFFSPSGGQPARRQPLAWLYSFRDIVGLRAIAELRQYVPLQRLRKVARVLKEHVDEPWANLVFYVIDRHVYYRDEYAAIRRADPSGQVAMPFELARVIGAVERDVTILRARGEDHVGKIVRLRNRALLSGTRIPTAAIWGFHTAGYDNAEIQVQYPQLAARDIQVAIAFEEARLSRVG
jgi:DNA-binding transcriptional MerR regulator